MLCVIINNVYQYQLTSLIFIVLLMSYIQVVTLYASWPCLSARPIRACNFYPKTENKMAVASSPCLRVSPIGIKTLI